MDIKVADLIADVKLRTEEIKSSMLVLHYALSNSGEAITFEDIDNFIEVLLSKNDEIYNELINFEEKNFN